MLRRSGFERMSNSDIFARSGADGSLLLSSYATKSPVGTTPQVLARAELKVRCVHCAKV
jgi:hypothetical protein